MDDLEGEVIGEEVHEGIFGQSMKKGTPRQPQDRVIGVFAFYSDADGVSGDFIIWKCMINSAFRKKSVNAVGIISRSLLRGFPESDSA